MNDTPARRFSGRKARIAVVAAIGIPLAAGAVLALTIPASAAPATGSPASHTAALDTHSGDVGSVVQGQAKVDPKLNLKDGSGSISAGPDGKVPQANG